MRGRPSLQTDCGLTIADKRRALTPRVKTAGPASNYFAPPSIRPRSYLRPSFLGSEMKIFASLRQTDSFFWGFLSSLSVSLVFSQRWRRPAIFSCGVRGPFTFDAHFSPSFFYSQTGPFRGTPNLRAIPRAA